MKYLRTISLIFLIIIILIFGVYLFRNQILTSVIEKGGTKLNRAKVELSDFNNPIFTTHIEWENLEITNPDKTMYNIVETGPCKFELKFKPLLAGKFIVERIEFGDIRVDTKREKDGKIKLPPKKKKEKSKLVKLIERKLQEEKDNIPIFNPEKLKTDIDTDKILTAVDFKTPQKADSIETFVNSRSEFWRDRFQHNKYEERINTIQADITKIDIDTIEKKKDNVLELAAEIKKQLTTLKKIKNNSQQLYVEIEDDKESLQSDLNNFKQLKKEISATVKADYENALTLAQLPHSKIENVAAMLLGKKLTTILMQIVEKLEAAKQIEETAEPEIKEDKMPHLPKFWIKKIYIKGELSNGNLLQGDISHISSNQNITAKPTTVDLKAKFAQDTNLNIKAMLDFRDDKNISKVLLRADKIYIRKMKLFDFALLPKEINKAEAYLLSETILTDDKFSSNNEIKLQNIDFNLKTRNTKLGDDLKQLSDQLIISLSSFNLIFKTSYQNDRFNYSIKSDLGNKLKKEIEKTINSKIATARTKLRTEVEKRIEPYEKEVQRIINSKIKMLNKKMEEITGSSKYNINKIEDLEQKLEDLKQKELDKVEDKAKKSGEDVLEKLKDKFNW